MIRMKWVGGCADARADGSAAGAGAAGVVAFFLTLLEAVFRATPAADTATATVPNTDAASPTMTFAKIS